MGVRGAAKWFVKEYMMQDAKSESLRNFIQEIIKEHFAFISSVLGGFWGFLILLSYSHSHSLPSNIFIELSTTDFFLIFAGSIILLSMLALLSAIPFLMVMDKIPEETPITSPIPQKRLICARFNTLKNIWNRLMWYEIIIVGAISLIVCVSLAYLFVSIIYQSLVDRSPLAHPQWYAYISLILAGVLVLEFLLIPINKKGILLRTIFIPLAFIILSPNISDNIIKFSTFGNKSVCLLLSEDNKNIVRMFVPRVSTAISDGKYFTATPVHLVFQTKEYLYLQDTDKNRPVFQLSTKDNLLFTPSIREGKDKQREEYCDPI